MATYFPYSQIISEICNQIDKTITRTSYVGPGQFFGGGTQERPKLNYGNISELYY